MLTPQPFEIVALAALLADSVTTYMGLRAGLREAHPVLRFFATLGGLRLPWAPGLVMAAITIWQHHFNYANFVSDGRQRIGWMIAAAVHAAVALFNIRSISRG